MPTLPFVATAPWTTSSSECRHATLHDLGSHPAPASVIEGNRIYVPCIYVLNKIDSISVEELDLLYKIPNSVPISSKLWLNIDELVDKVRGEMVANSSVHLSDTVADVGRAEAGQGVYQTQQGGARL